MEAAYHNSEIIDNSSYYFFHSTTTSPLFQSPQKPIAACSLFFSQTELTPDARDRLGLLELNNLLFKQAKQANAKNTSDMCMYIQHEKNIYVCIYVTGFDTLPSRE